MGKGEEGTSVASTAITVENRASIQCLQRDGVASCFFVVLIFCVQSGNFQRPKRGAAAGPTREHRWEREKRANDTRASQPPTEERK
jgi:hypothetical protein